jgi:hypothetical protein
LPEHCWQRAGNIFRPGWAGCLTGWNPVPSHAEHSTSATARFGLGLFMKFVSLERETLFASSFKTGRPPQVSIGMTPDQSLSLTVPLSRLLSPLEIASANRIKLPVIFYPLIFYPFRTCNHGNFKLLSGVARD